MSLVNVKNKSKKDVANGVNVDYKCRGVSYK